MDTKPAYLQRIWRKFVNNPVASRSVNPIYGWEFLSDFFGIQESSSGEKVTVESGARTSTAFSCINVLAQDVAKLPFNIRQDTNKGKVIIKNNLYHLIHTRPNLYTPAFNFWYNIVFNMFSYGDGFALIKRIEGKPDELIILNPNETSCVLIENEIFYQYRGVLLKQEDVLHFKVYSFDGIKGVSPIIWNTETFGYKIKQDKYKAKVLGSKPHGLISFDQELSDEQAEQNREAWKRMTSGAELGGTPVLSGGAKYTPFTIPPSEGQMIEASELTQEEIAGIYRVPPTLIQNYRRATFSNAEQQDLVYLKYSLTPILRVIEQECDFKLFPELNKTSQSPLYTKFNIKGMLRGDIKTQAEWYKMLRTLGLANANTILEMEDMPPLEGEAGEMVVIQGAMVPLDQLREFYQGKSTGQDNDLRQLGFDLERLKEAMSRQEILNQHEEGLHK